MNEVDQKNGRIKYFPPSHFAYPFYIAKIPMFLDALVDKTCKKEDDINDIIECYNVARYLEEDYLPPKLEEEERSRYLKQKGALRCRIKSFFDSVDTDNLNILEKCDAGYFNYDDDLFFLLVEYGVDKKVGIQTIIKLWENISGSPQLLLRRKRLVDEYDSAIRKLITTNNKFAEFLIQYYFSREKVEGIHLSLKIYRDTILNMFKSYIKQDSSKLDYLRYISESVPRYGLKIPSELKTLAKNCYDELVGRERLTGNIIDVDFCAKIEVVENGGKLEEKDGPGYIEYKYSAESIDLLIEKDSVLAFFLKDFYTDSDLKYVVGLPIETSDYILYFPFFKLDTPIGFRVLENFGNGEYDENFTFRVQNEIVLKHIKMFEERMMRKYNRSIEKEISLYFNEKIKEKYGVGGFIFEPSTSRTYRERSMNLAIQIESIARQFKSIKDNEVNQELLSNCSSQVYLTDLPSYVKHKYVEVNNDSAMPEILEMLFSKDGQYSLADLIKEGERGCFNEQQKTYYCILVECGVLLKDREHNIAMIYLLEQLYQVDALTYPRYARLLKEQLDAFVDRGWLKWKDSLLTTKEEGFFSFYLDAKQFNNNLGLRNSYAHYTFKKDEGAHRKNYIILLMLYIILISKIDADLAWGFLRGNSEKLIQHPQT